MTRFMVSGGSGTGLTGAQAQQIARANVHDMSGLGDQPTKTAATAAAAGAGLPANEAVWTSIGGKAAYRAAGQTAWHVLADDARDPGLDHGAFADDASAPVITTVLPGDFATVAGDRRISDGVAWVPIGAAPIEWIPLAAADSGVLTEGSFDIVEDRADVTLPSMPTSGQSLWLRNSTDTPVNLLGAAVVAGTPPGQVLSIPAESMLLVVSDGTTLTGSVFESVKVSGRFLGQFADVASIAVPAGMAGSATPEDGDKAKVGADEKLHLFADGEWIDVESSAASVPAAGIDPTPNTNTPNTITIPKTRSGAVLTEAQFPVGDRRAALSARRAIETFVVAEMTGTVTRPVTMLGATYNFTWTWTEDATNYYVDVSDVHAGWPNTFGASFGATPFYAPIVDFGPLEAEQVVQNDAIAAIEAEQDVQDIAIAENTTHRNDTKIHVPDQTGEAGKSLVANADPAQPAVWQDLPLYGERQFPNITTETVWPTPTDPSDWWVIGADTTLGAIPVETGGRIMPATDTGPWTADTDWTYFPPPAEAVELTQPQVEDPTSPDFGLVSGQRLRQAIGAGVIYGVTPNPAPADLAALEVAVPAAGQPADRQWQSLLADNSLAQVIAGSWVIVSDGAVASPWLPSTAATTVEDGDRLIVMPGSTLTLPPIPAAGDSVVVYLAPDSKWEGLAYTIATAGADTFPTVEVFGNSRVTVIGLPGETEWRVYEGADGAIESNIVVDTRTDLPAASTVFAGRTGVVLDEGGAQVTALGSAGAPAVGWST